MKFFLGAILVVLGVFKLVELQESNPKVGWVLTILIVSLWLVEVAKMIWKERR